MKPISTKAHAMLDYALGLLLLFMPYLLSLDAPGPEDLVFYAAGTFVLLYGFVTRYELGFLQLLPIRVHYALDFLTGIALGAAPWLLGFADKVWLPHAVLGMVLLLLPVLTNRKANDSNLIDT